MVLRRRSSRLYAATAGEVHARDGRHKIVVAARGNADGFLRSSVAGARARVDLTRPGAVLEDLVAAARRVHPAARASGDGHEAVMAKMPKALLLAAAIPFGRWLTGGIGWSVSPPVPTMNSVNPCAGSALPSGSIGTVR